MTSAEQIARFEWMLAQCELHGWDHLAEWIFESYIKFQNEHAEHDEAQQ
jgi:hypothetical protein